MPRANGKDKKRNKALFTADELKILKPFIDSTPPVTDLPIEAINIDYSYQERPRERIVDQIATSFQAALLGVLKVSQRPDGTYWACDGATRVLGLIRRCENKRRVACEVFQTEGRRAEALLMAWFNGRRSREPIKVENIYQAEYVAGTDHGFGKSVHDCGFSFVGGHRPLHGARYVKTAFLLDNNGEAMRKTLFTLKDAWDDKYPYWGYWVLGVAKVYNAYPRQSLDAEIRRVLKNKNNPPSDVMDRILRRYIKLGGKGRIHPDAKPDLIAGLIVELINRNPARSGSGGKGKLDRTKLDESPQQMSAGA